ncbi:TetR/AcrR family transcriptional regulator [Herbaspirillum sp. AP02]|jgi:AcrR family transcriptional regulator|nr:MULTISPECIES: TetR/AcrR family transcriptional regulator [Herbaspirillum]MBG7619942.1 TetR/AcrR family transcriptional regulator [Herbaspirillum sp. AP02]MCI1013141.1 TetR/AcrR family transcriptional regulator [Herbaspirillum sp. C7C2]MDR6582738.1 AcrR family transcriptional regulator [Herbaspirillum frisingense]NZD68994.1 TetR/AcrR family transcriptional regulator [Herbaspirillum sp. AP21]ONN65923.1 TetR family transcriptional regulator [Herbaspirillum sp. VT-16-41]
MKLQPRKEPRQARSRAMVDTILDAMSRVLVERGYAKTNTNLVAESAGISVGSLYQYFPNKDALIFALRERHVSRMLGLFEDVVAHIDAAGSLREDFDKLIGALVAAHLLEPELNRILEEEFPAYNLPVSSEIRQRFFEAIRRVLEKHRSSITTPDLDVATFVLQRMLKALINAVVLTGPGGLSAGSVRPEILPAVIGYLTAPREDSQA